MSASEKSYFGWSHVLHNRSIRRLEPTSFKELVTNFFNVPHCVPVTREEYRALEQAERDAKSPEEKEKAKAAKMEVKDSPFVTNCSFTGSVKKQEFADAITLVCIDLDDPAIARQFDEAPEALAESLWPYNFVCYRTIGWTPENPKLRLIVDLATSPVALLPQFVTYSAKLAGLPDKWSGRTESMTLGQAMFRPVKFQGEEFAAVIASRVTGVHMDEIDLPPDLTEEVKRTFAYQRDEDLDDDDCDLDNLPVPGLTVEDVREALYAIDPDLGRQQWYEICAGLRFQFRDEESAEAAFDLWDEWSSGGDKYTGRDACLSTWTSFKPERKGRRPITIRTLFKFAQDAGWQNTKVAEKLEQSVEEKIEACEDLNELLREGPKWVAALPFSTVAIEENLLAQISKRSVRLKGNKVSITSLKKDVAKARREAKAETPVTVSPPAWLRTWCYISSLNEFFNPSTGILLSPDAFDNTHLKLMPKGDTDSERAAMRPKEFALSTEGMIEIVDAMIYDPRHGGEKPYFKVPGNECRFVNEYRLSTLPKLDSRNSVLVMERFMDHLLKLMSKEHALHLMDWCAHTVQFPGKRIRHAPFIQGAQGCGKSIISGYLGAAIGGEANAKVVGPKEIASDFSGWATGGQLTTIEEIWVQGKGRAAVMNSLKPLITNDRVTITKKCIDPVTMDNVTNYIAYSNHRNALYLEPDDRRWFVIMSFIQSRAQRQALELETVSGMPYFEYHGMIIEKYAGAIRHGLLNYQIRSSFNPNGVAPETEFRLQVIEDCKNPLQRKMEHIIEDKVHPLVSHDIIFMPALEGLLADMVNSKRLSAKLLIDNHTPEHFAYNMGYHPWGGPAARFGMNGSGKGQIWVHNERFDDCLGDPEMLLWDRYEQIPEDSI